MNGEFLELYNKLSKDFAVFEAKQKERWKSHTERAEERKESLDKELNDVNLGLKDLGVCIDKLPCGSNSIKMQALEDSIFAIKNNDLKHLQEDMKVITNRITILVFTVIGGMGLAVLKWLFRF